MRRRKSLISPLKEEATSQSTGGSVREKERRKKERWFVKAR